MEPWLHCLGDVDTSNSIHPNGMCTYMVKPSYSVFFFFFLSLPCTKISEFGVYAFIYISYLTACYCCDKQMAALFRIGSGTPPPVPDSLSKEARDFIFQCFHVNPRSRPTASQLLDHPFVRVPLPLFTDYPSAQSRKQHF